MHQTEVALKFELTKFTVYDLVKLFQGSDYLRKFAMLELIKAAKILLVMPASKAISERSLCHETSQNLLEVNNNR